MAFYGVGQGVTAGPKRVIAHGFVGGVSAAASGGDFARGFVAASFTKLVSPDIEDLMDPAEVEILIAGIVGGIASEIVGGDFANGATTAAMAFAFNALGDSRSTSAEVETPTLSVDSDFMGPLTESDFRNIEVIQDSLAVVAEAVSASNDPEAIEILNSGIEVTYYPSGIPGYSDYAAFADTDEMSISFGPHISLYANSANTFLRQNYFGLRLRGGGVQTVSRIMAHEYGHFSQAAMRAGFSPRNERPASGFANRVIPHLQ